MLSGDFQKKLRKCSSKLRIFCGNDENRPAGIFDASDPETSIVGIDKNNVPEWPVYCLESGRILKSGWKRALRVLIEQGHLDRARTERVFGCQIIGTRRPLYQFSGTVDKVQNEIQASYARGMNRTGKPAMSKTELMDIASEVKVCK